MKQLKNNISKIKTPPHCADSEKATLAGLMLSTESFDKVGHLLDEDDFYFARHRHIFKAAEYLNIHNEPCDVVTVSEWLRSHELTSETGGIEYLTEITEQYPVVSNVLSYANIVRDRSLLRGVIEIGTKLVSSSNNTEGLPVSELLENAEKLVFRLKQRASRNRSGFHDIKNVLSDVIDQLEVSAERQTDITGIPYGWSELDKITAGLQNSDLIIVAGRPAMGKTSFAINIAERAACNELSVAVFSMEMAATQLTTRMFSSLSQVDSTKLKLGNLSSKEFERIGHTAQILNTASLHIDDTPAQSPNEIASKCRWLKLTQGLDLVIVDYLQLMQVKGKKTENRANEISEISRSLKAMAKELDVPVIALSQLNRTLEQRQNKRPIMSDLRESGSIEQDADIILFIYRDEVYNEQSDSPGVAEIIISKHRNGSIGTVKLSFVGQYTRFNELVSESDSIVI